MAFTVEDRWLQNHWYRRGSTYLLPYLRKPRIVQPLDIGADYAVDAGLISEAEYYQLCEVDAIVQVRTGEALHKTPCSWLSRS
jgi:hypothetical protein